MGSFSEVLSNTCTAFSIYVLSTTAALGINAAVQEYIAKHDATWKRFVWALAVCVFAILVITVIAFLNKLPTESSTAKRLSGQKNTEPQSLGRI
jgi:uncharacterized membrane protein YedE/YeeE